MRGDRTSIRRSSKPIYSCFQSFFCPKLFGSARNFHRRSALSKPSPRSKRRSVAIIHMPNFLLKAMQHGNAVPNASSLLHVPFQAKTLVGGFWNLPSTPHIDFGRRDLESDPLHPFLYSYPFLLPCYPSLLRLTKMAPFPTLSPPTTASDPSTPFSPCEEAQAPPPSSNMCYLRAFKTPGPLFTLQLMRWILSSEVNRREGYRGAQGAPSFQIAAASSPPRAVGARPFHAPVC